MVSEQFVDRALNPLAWTSTSSQMTAVRDDKEG